MGRNNKDFHESKLDATIAKRKAFKSAMDSGDSKKAESLIESSYDQNDYNNKFNPAPKGPHADALEAASKNGGLTFTTQWLDSQGDR
jgi:hypothetical protein